MIYSLDIETTGVDRFKDRILLIGVYNSQEGYRSYQTIEEFKRALETDLKHADFVCHNGSFDINFLKHFGVDLNSKWAYDTRSIASIHKPFPEIAEGEKHALSLQNLYKTLIGGTAYKLDREKMESYSDEAIQIYNEKDCQVTFDLFKYFLKNYNEKDWSFVESWLMPATKLCAELEFNGIYGDWKGLAAYKTEIEKMSAKVLEELNQLTEEPRRFYKQKEIESVKETYATLVKDAKAKLKEKTEEKLKKTDERYQKLLQKALEKVEDFNWNSPVQLAWLFKDFYGLDLNNKRTGKETTNEEKLKELDHPVAKKLIEHRELTKLLTQQIPALLDNVKADECCHGRFMVGGTRTGRLASAEPNLQQISARKPIGRRIRSFIQAKPGNVLVTIDYAQIEPRIIAHNSGEQKLIQAFKNDIDIYSVFASEIFGITDCDLKEFKKLHPTERACGKTGGLSVLYGTGAQKFTEMVRKETGISIPVGKAKLLIENFRNGLPAVQEYKKNLERALANGKTCYNLLGRPFYIASNDDLYMLGLNTDTQSTASDLVIESQKLVKEVLQINNLPYTYRLLVHDECVIELPAQEAEIITKSLIIPTMTKKMEERLGLTVPLKVEYTINNCWQKS